MNKPIEYKLRKDELVIQIHHTLRELFPDRLFMPDEIRDSLVEDEYGINFMGAKFADMNMIEANELLNSLYIELGIEFEKNLHDKFYFVMTKDNESLHFRTVTNNG